MKQKQQSLCGTPRYIREFKNSKHEDMLWIRPKWACLLSCVVSQCYEL